MRRQMQMDRNNTHGFSLVEVLVVLCIFGALMALLLPTLSRMKELRNSTVCRSNLRQLYSGCQMYSADHDNQLVPMASGTGPGDALTWRALIAPYLCDSLKQMRTFICPSDPVDKSYLQNTSAGVQGLRPASYGINMDVSVDSSHPYVYMHDYIGSSVANRVFKINQPSRTIFLSEMGKIMNASAPPNEWKEITSGRGGNFGYVRFPSDPAFVGSDAWNPAPRHAVNKVNVVFYDGHVDTVNLAADILAHSPSDPDCLYYNR